MADNKMLVLEIIALVVVISQAVPVQQNISSKSRSDTITHQAQPGYKEENKLENELVDTAVDRGNHLDTNVDVNDHNGIVNRPTETNYSKLKSSLQTVGQAKPIANNENRQYDNGLSKAEIPKNPYSEHHGDDQQNDLTTSDEKQVDEDKYTVDLIVSIVKSLRQNPKLLLLVIQDILSKDSNSETDAQTNETETEIHGKDNDDNVYRELRKLKKRPNRLGEHEEKLNKKGSIPPAPVLETRADDDVADETIDVERINGHQFDPTKHQELDVTNPKTPVQILNPNHEDKIVQPKQQHVQKVTSLDEHKPKEIKHDMKSTENLAKGILEKGSLMKTKQGLYKYIEQKAKTNHETLAEELQGLASQPKEHLRRERKNGNPPAAM